MMFLVPALAAPAPALIPARLPFPLPRIYRGHLEPANFQLSPVFVRDSELWASKIFHIFLAGGPHTNPSLFKKVLSARSQPAWFCDAICFHSVTIHSSALLLTPELRLIYPVASVRPSRRPSLVCPHLKLCKRRPPCLPASCCSTNEILRDFHYDRRDALRD